MGDMLSGFTTRESDVPQLRGFPPTTDEAPPAESEGLPHWQGPFSPIRFTRGFPTTTETAPPPPAEAQPHWIGRFTVTAFARIPLPLAADTPPVVVQPSDDPPCSQGRSDHA
jgi:hypothetical protein